MEDILSVCVGVGLAAACGFRVFVPLLIMSVAAQTGHLSLGESFAWIGSTPALVAFGVATVLEVAGYYVPWVDNLLDSVATPAAVVAGTVVAASFFSDFSPFLRWTLAVIAGGGAAGLVQGGTVVARAASTATTGGLGNPAVATAELGLSAVTALLALVWPVLAVCLLALLGLFVGRKLLRRRRQNRPGTGVAGSPARLA